MMVMLGGVLGRLLFCEVGPGLRDFRDLNLCLAARKMLTSLGRRQFSLRGKSVVIEVDGVCRSRSEMVSCKINRCISTLEEYRNVRRKNIGTILYPVIREICEG